MLTLFWTLLAIFASVSHAQYWPPNPCQLEYPPDQYHCYSNPCAVPYPADLEAQYKAYVQTGTTFWFGEALDNGKSEYQEDITGVETFGPALNQIPAEPFHDTGTTLEQFFNPVQQGTLPPNSNYTEEFVDCTTGTRAIGLNMGTCTQLSWGRNDRNDIIDGGIWQCPITLTIFKDAHTLMSCFQPDSQCQAAFNHAIVGELAYIANFPAVPAAGSLPEYFEFPGHFISGTYIFEGARCKLKIRQYTATYAFAYGFTCHYDDD